LPLKIFEHKQLFCEFMYKCICDPEIKAYLPRESVKLINDFDDFPITYFEGCRRLIHCIHKLEVLKLKNQKQFKHVAIDEMFGALEKSFNQVFKPFKGHNEHVRKKYIKCTLDETEDFYLLDKYLNKLDYYKVEEREKKSEE
jgi:dTDP-D-glucose 4,6-dehydratase